MLKKLCTLWLVTLVPSTPIYSKKFNEPCSISDKLLKLTFRDLFPDAKSDFPIIREHDKKRNIYVVNVLPQNELNTCGRHAIKNLIYFMSAIEQSNDEDLKQELKHLYDQQTFESLNKAFCNFFNLCNIYTDLTFPHKIFSLLSNFDYSVSTYFTRLSVYKDIIKQIWQMPMSFNKRNAPFIKRFIHDLLYIDHMIFAIESDKSKHLETREFYAKYKDENNSTLNEDFKKYVEDFKKSDRNTLGLFILLTFEGLSSDPGHWISLVMRKSKNKSLEFFVLDSCHNTIKSGLKNTLDSLLNSIK